MDELALFGGKPVWDTSWPRWPIASENAKKLLAEVVDSGRWAISGQWTGEDTWDQRFNVRFAEYVGVRYCFTIDHGSSALLVALLALDIGPGDEVIVPSLTWVACASAVMRVGAKPIFVDIEHGSLCLSPAAIEAAISKNTKCIIVVHLYSCMADVTTIRQIADNHGVGVVEDCAQAHGAEWDGQRAGSFGDIAAFSMQQGKPLTSGEGGAILTNDEALADRLQRLRCDGRRYTSGPRQLASSDLEEVSGLQGMNLCLSEFQAALLCDRLDHLDKETELRAAHAGYLDSILASNAWLEPVVPYPNNTRRAYYHYSIRISKGIMARVPVSRIRQALAAELGANLGDRLREPYVPLPQHPLFAPNTLRALPKVSRSNERELPVANDQSQRTLLFHHSLLLADKAAMDAIAAAFKKVLDHVDRLATSQ